MSTEDDLLNDFFAEINSLPTPSLNTEPEKKKVINGVYLLISRMLLLPILVLSNAPIVFIYNCCDE